MHDTPNAHVLVCVLLKVTLWKTQVQIAFSRVLKLFVCFYEAQHNYAVFCKQFCFVV